MKKLLWVVMAVIITGLVFGKIYDGSRPYEKIGYALDTQIRIVAYDGQKSKQAVENAYNEILRLDKLLSNFNETSETFTLNKNGKMNVSPELLEVIKTGISVSLKTEGKYDLTVLPLAEIWNYKKAVVPKPEEINAAQKKVNYKNVEINENVVTLKDGAQIDVSSVAKGYIADYIIDYLINHSVKTALVDAGGNIKVVGSINKNGFKIGIKDPFSKEGATYGQIDVVNKSVVTSGIYERNFTYNNKTYHHIIDIQKGYPAESDVVCATVISENSAIADAYATAIVVVGAEEGLKLIESVDEAECIIVNNKKEVILSEGIDNFEITNNDYKLK